MTNSIANRSRSNRRTASRLMVLAVAMFGFGYLLIPLYDVICDITGFNGRTGDAVAEERLDGVVDESRTVTVQFLATVNSSLQWDFEPVAASMRVHPGELYEASYVATNLAKQVVVGQAVPSVTPIAAAPYLRKTECFCFNEQRFEARETREMPIRFIVSRDLPPEVKTLTLSYTFFNSKG